MTNPSPRLLPEQIRHEEAISAAQAALLKAVTRTQRQTNAWLLVALIKARDPAITDGLEEARMRRVGL